MAFLRAIDTTEADPFSALVVEDFESVAVENGDDGAGELTRKGRTGEQEPVEEGPETMHRPHASRIVTPWRGNHYRSFSWMRTR